MSHTPDKELAEARNLCRKLVSRLTELDRLSDLTNDAWLVVKRWQREEEEERPYGSDPCPCSCCDEIGRGCEGNLQSDADACKHLRTWRAT